MFEPAVLEQFKRYAQTENLKRKALDAKALARLLGQACRPTDRKDSRVAAAAAQCFIALGGCAEAHRIIEESLEQNWDSTLLPLYVECLPRDARRHLERAEGWLKQHPGDPALLLALGQLCVEQELWGKARSYLEASLAIEPSHTAYVSWASCWSESASRKRRARSIAAGWTWRWSSSRTAPAAAAGWHCERAASNNYTMINRCQGS